MKAGTKVTVMMIDGQPEVYVVTGLDAGVWVVETPAGNFRAIPWSSIQYLEWKIEKEETPKKQKPALEIVR